MVQLINKKTFCRVEVLINSRVVNERVLNIPNYPMLRDWQAIVTNREIYINKKVSEIRADYELLGVDYEVAVYFMSKV